MHNHLRIVWRSLVWLALVSLLGATAGLLVLHHRGERLLSVQTASMVPTFQPGDALIVSPVRPGQLRVGDIVSYQSPRNPQVIISHRLVAIDNHTGLLTTAGDALHTSDKSFSSQLIVGRAQAVAPQLGVVLDFLHRPLGLALVVYLPASLVIVYEIYAFVGRSNQVRYQEFAYARR